MIADSATSLHNWKLELEPMGGLKVRLNKARIQIIRNARHPVPLARSRAAANLRQPGFVYATWPREFLKAIVNDWSSRPPIGYQDQFITAGPTWNWLQYDGKLGPLDGLGLHTIIQWMFNANFFDRTLPFDASLYQTLFAPLPNGPFTAAPIFTMTASPARGVWSYNWTNSPVAPWFLTWVRIARLSRSNAAQPFTWHYAWQPPTPNFGPGALTGSFDMSKFPRPIKPGDRFFVGLQVGENGLAKASPIGWTMATAT